MAFGAKQMEMWKISTEYCYVLRSIFDDGTAATLEANDFRALIYIKMCASFQDGYSFPSYSKIGEQCGIKRQTAMTCVKRLVEKGLVVKEKRGTTYGYRVVERLTARSIKEDDATALLEHYYIPNQVKTRQREYKEFARTGKNPNPAEITITVNVNVQNNIITNNENTTVNVSPQVSSIEALANIANEPDVPVGTREEALRILRMANDPRFEKEVVEKISKMLLGSIQDNNVQ